MKNAKKYEVKFKSLIKGFKKAKMPEVPVVDGITKMVLTILRGDASDRQAEKALQAIQKEYVDFNELRVSQPKEIVECIGEDYPDAKEKAYLLGTALNEICNKYGSLTLEPLAELNKREIRKLLREFGMGEFAEAYISMTVFGIHAFPVDISLAGLLEVQEYVSPDAGTLEIQGFLERVISQKDAYGVYIHLREHVSKHRRTAVRTMEKRVVVRTENRKKEMERRLREEQQRKMEEFDQSLAAAGNKAKNAKAAAAAKTEGKTVEQTEPKAQDKVEEPKVQKASEKKKTSKSVAMKKSLKEAKAKAASKKAAKSVAKKVVKKKVKAVAKKAVKKTVKKAAAKKVAKKAAAKKTTAKKAKKK